MERKGVNCMGYRLLRGIKYGFVLKFSLILLTKHCKEVNVKEWAFLYSPFPSTKHHLSLGLDPISSLVLGLIKPSCAMLLRLHLQWAIMDFQTKGNEEYET